MPEPVVPFLEDARSRVRPDPELARRRVEVLHGSVGEQAGEDEGSELRIEGLEGGDAVSWLGEEVVESGLKK